MRRWVMAVGTIFGLIPGLCVGAEPANVDRQAATEFFEKKIRPLLVQRCDECHSTDKADESGHLALDNRASFVAGGTRGPVLVAGKPDESLLIKAVRYLDPKLQMPPEGKLADTEIELLSKWVQDGAFIPDYGQDAGNKRNKSIDWDAARQFWSFRALIRPDVPVVETGQQIHNPIDAFVTRPLRDAKLIPAPTADGRTLIRRLSFDLLGLPPSPDEVAEFLADERPDAYERLVDRLLASPHFGERWARYWLDLARYVDFTPDWQKNTDRAWMYRDWVVRAFNEDRPYDEFVQMQLAADLIPEGDPRDIAALGLLGVSPTYWKELKLAPSVIEVIVADEWDERLDTVSRTFLGLTVACARCHDHKFDPVTSKDYYALAGIFASTQVADRPLLPSPLAEQVAEARAKLDKLQESWKKQKEKESDEARKLQTQIDELRQANPQIDALLAPVVEESSVYVVADGPDATKLEYRKHQSRDLPVFRRGNPGNPGEIVPRRFLELFANRADGEPTLAPYGQGSGRLELAHSLVNEARPLTARVVVNRIWLNHFGKGLVKTPGDFGQQGDRPSHPELLDWLASELVSEGAGPAGSPWKKGADALRAIDTQGESMALQRVRPLFPRWSLKHLHRLMVTSATYRQSSTTGATATDPENQLLARMNRRRLDIEPWRDAMLAVAGNLDDRLEGPGAELDQKINHRRTLYGRIGRDEQNDMLRIFDFPPPTTHSPSRDNSTTPLQQLFVFNSDFVEQQATTLAVRLLEPADATVPQRIERCYQLLFQRAPRPVELQLGEQFLGQSTGSESTEQDRWRWYVQSLFGLNEFLFVD
ncbi:MAG: DUF1549 domain-containing protein [Planctomycetes bacterium]|nr:DUF1549 domain-containing protein [Planctomycetota bacterium]